MSTAIPELPALITLPEAARILGISRASAYRYAEAGQLPVKRFGRRVYVVRAQLMDFLAGTNITHGEAA
jgi:excisionase family DNA binding protein